MDECTGGDRAAARQTWGLGPDEIVIGHLANNSREKGTIDLLEAATALWRRGVAARVLLAGPEMANFRAYWDHLVNRLPAELTARVVRLGILDPTQKRDFFAAIDLFALPSRSDSFGLVLLEAWANGVPNIAYAAGGVADVIRHQQDGILVPCDVPRLTDALADLRRCVFAVGGTSGPRTSGRDFCWRDKLNLVRKSYANLAKVPT